MARVQPYQLGEVMTDVKKLTEYLKKCQHELGPILGQGAFFTTLNDVNFRIKYDVFMFLGSLLADSAKPIIEHMEKIMMPMVIITPTQHQPTRLFFEKKIRAINVKGCRAFMETDPVSLDVVHEDILKALNLN